jgi:DUF4097 and DUF4098 domain-containing protein YvlB
VTAHKRVRVSKGIWGFFGGGTSEASVTAALDDIEVIMNADAGAITVDTKSPKRAIRSNRWVDYELHVPKRTALELHTSNGRIDINEVQGTIVAKSSNGQINTHATCGPVHAETSNGAIVCKDIQGPVELETSNGSITIDCADTLASDASIQCATSNGSIDVSLPTDAAFRLDAGTSNGRIKSDFPMAVTAGAKTQLAGEVGAGGPTVRLRSSNGGIHVTRQ